MTPIPLFWPELNQADERAVLAQLAREPFRDDSLVARWEAAWSGLWNRPAAAFADAGELISRLKMVLGWRSGDWIGADPLLAPVWRESYDAAWLHVIHRDVHPVTGHGSGPFPIPIDGTPLRAVMVQHSHGLPAPLPSGALPMRLEEVSARLLPVMGSGMGEVQLLCLDGNRVVSAGGSCVVLAHDGSLIAALKEKRRFAPAPAACVLGLSQLSRLRGILQMRQALAEAYLTMRHRDLFVLPENPPGGRVWDTFAIALPGLAAREGLEGFLRKSGIGAAAPLWFQTVAPGRFPGLDLFRERLLALPLYSALTTRAQKQIINRIHRWVERTLKRS